MEKKLADWILKALEIGSSVERLNEDIKTGVSACYLELTDNNYYEFHFICRENEKKISHISATREKLTDSFNYRGADPNSTLSYNENKLDALCKKIIKTLHTKGNFKLAMTEDNKFDIVPM